VDAIFADLTCDIDLTSARDLPENTSIQHEGDKKGGLFEVEIAEARQVLSSPVVSSKSAMACIRPWFNGLEVNGRATGLWIIDFGTNSDIASASQFPLAFGIVRDRVGTKYGSTRSKWWLHERSRPDMRAALQTLDRYLVTVRHTPHRVFRWATNPSLPDSAVVCFARSDDYIFGVLHAAAHVLWARRIGTQVREKESGDRYVAKCFESFPLPWSPTREDAKNPAYKCISTAAKELNDMRERWLNPPEWLEPLTAKIDAADDFSDVPAEARPLIRHSAIMAAAAKDPRLKKRTLTNLYNERPTWLKLAHEKLDRAVLAAYAATDPEGNWCEDWAEVFTDTGAGQPLPPNHPLTQKRADVEKQILENLLRLNHVRAGKP
jgi:hypothetical protein